MRIKPVKSIWDPVKTIRNQVKRIWNNVKEIQNELEIVRILNTVKFLILNSEFSYGNSESVKEFEIHSKESQIDLIKRILIPACPGNSKYSKATSVIGILSKESGLDSVKGIGTLVEVIRNPVKIIREPIIEI